jgi:hypothetical protein
MVETTTQQSGVRPSVEAGAGQAGAALPLYVLLFLISVFLQWRGRRWPTNADQR